MKLKTGKRKVNRTAAGNVAVFLFLLLFGVFFLLPIVYAIATAFKPLNEIFIFPPRLIVKHPTTQNFLKLSQVLRDYFVPFSLCMVLYLSFVACPPRMCLSALFLSRTNLAL